MSTSITSLYGTNVPLFLVSVLDKLLTTDRKKATYLSIIGTKVYVPIGTQSDITNVDKFSR